MKAESRAVHFATAAMVAGLGAGCTRVDSPAAVEQFSVVSTDGYLAVPPPACQAGQWMDFGCDERIPLGCEFQGKRIDADYSGMDVCPVCVDPAVSDPITCEGWQARYGDFLASTISGSCANWCDDTAAFCAGWQITNACGTFAIALSPNIDEEPILFAEEFARENCGVCGAVEQTVLSGSDGAAELFRDYDWACLEHQCVLVRRAGTGSPDAGSLDAAPLGH